MGETIVGLLEQVIERQPLLQDLSPDATPTWSEISKRWKAK
jgi:hypothetical protein